MSTDNAVLTLTDLASWPKPGGSFAVLGQPIKHSVSPAMHNAALERASIADPRWKQWHYHRFEVAPTDLPIALPRFHKAGFSGLNLTVPHKVLARDLVEEIDNAARPIGAVNTLRRTPTGWKGFNTDGYGLASGLAADLGLQLKGAFVLLLGAGGAARGAAVQCLQEGVASLWIANRTQSNLDTIIADLNPLVPAGCQLRGFSPSNPPAELPEGCIVINATSAGLKLTDPLPIEIGKLPRPAAAYDMIYNPTETAFLRSAKTLGIPTANGLSMLVHQGAKSLEIWTGIPAKESAAIMAKAAKTALGLA